MYVQGIGFQGVKPHLSEVGLSDPLRTVNAISHLRDAAAAMNCSLQTSTNFANLSQARRMVRGSDVSPMFDANVNKCLSCHARSRTGESQAPMVSITHFMDRDGQFLATISPRRSFCSSHGWIKAAFSVSFLPP